MILTEKKISSRFEVLAEVAFYSEPVAGAKLASMIEYKGDVISIETNSFKTHPMQKMYGKNPHSIYLHSEVSAIRKALYYLDPTELMKSVLYVCRVKKDGSWGLSLPCVGCQRCIDAMGITQVYYSTETGYKSL